MVAQVVAQVEAQVEATVEATVVATVVATVAATAAEAQAVRGEREEVAEATEEMARRTKRNPQCASTTG